MKESILKVCPICGKELKISKLQCTECDMEYSGNFNMSVFFKLEDAEIEFIKEFLKNEGNISKIQKDSGRTYANVKSLINNINIKLGLIKEKKENVDMGFFDQKNETGIVKVIQDKFLECGGVSKMPMLKGNPLDIIDQYIEAGFYKTISSEVLVDNCLRRVTRQTSILKKQGLNAYDDFVEDAKAKLKPYTTEVISRVRPVVHMGSKTLAKVFGKIADKTKEKND